MIGILIGFALDFILGDPYCMPHPVRWMGRLIQCFENIVRRYFLSEKALKVMGFLIVFFVVGITGVTSYGILYVCFKINVYLGVAANALMCYYALAMRCLKNESMKVYYALEEGNTEKARQAVSMIVGRDTKSLDDKGITKAAVETVAENTSDGVTAPLFYMCLGLGPLAMIYKAVNTMDSMIGYKDEKYINIGMAAAKLDDIVNFIPSRLSALFIIAACFLLGYDYKNSLRIWKRDRLNHSSPNSAQTEAAFAGGLDIRLGGDAYYFGKLYKKKFIGDNIKQIQYKDIKSANKIMFTTAFLFLVAGIILRGIVIWLWF